MSARSRCERFAHDGPLAVERGSIDEEHLASCNDCRSARETYGRLAGLVASAASDFHPAAGWEARVRHRITERATARRRRWQIGGAAAVVAVAAATVLSVAYRRREPEQIALHLSVTTGDTAVRTTSPHPGDILQLDADLGRARGAELRVYWVGHRLVLRCAPDELDRPVRGCRRDGGRVRAELVLPTVGRFRAMLLRREREAPLPAPTDSLDHDVDAAQAAGAHVILSDPLEVL